MQLHDLDRHAWTGEGTGGSALWEATGRKGADCWRLAVECVVDVTRFRWWGLDLAVHPLHDFT